MRAKLCLDIPTTLQRNVLEDEGLIVDPRVAANRLARSDPGIYHAIVARQEFDRKTMGKLDFEQRIMDFSIHDLPSGNST